ncbi:MAG: ABC transporter substrate-binding protein [Nitrospirota bacterium]
MRRPLRTARIIAALLLGAAFLAGCDQGSRRPGGAAREQVTFAVVPLPLSAPVYVAAEKGYFRDEGLNVTLAAYSSGKEALTAVIAGTAAFGVTAETPVVYAVLQGAAVSVIATIAETDSSTKIVARKDRGIHAPEDLRGKRIGVTSGTNNEFFLYSFLLFNEMSSREVRTVDIGADQIPGALLRGEVDAVSIWEPHVSVLEEKLGDKALVFHSKALYVMSWNVVSRQELVARSPGTVRKILHALSRAEELIAANGEEARKITASAAGTDLRILARQWNAYTFNLSLSQTLLLSLEEQARWALAGCCPEAEMPNFLTFMHAEALTTVAPEAVTLIHE